MTERLINNNYLAYTTFNVPTGAYQLGRLANVGINHYSVDAGGGYTYLDAKKGTNSRSLAGSPTTSRTTTRTTGTASTATSTGPRRSFGASSSTSASSAITNYDQLTGDSGSGATLGDFKSRVAGIGPQAGYFFPVGKEKGYVNLVDLDGYNLLLFFKGEVKESPRKEFLYWSDDGDLFAIRVLDWKISFIEQHAQGLAIWEQEATRLRAPNIYNLRADPFERGTYSSWYPDWKAHRIFLIVPAQAVVAKWLESFKDYPIRQKPASFNLDEVMRKLTATQTGAH